jgi:signal peptide peptidase SppA
MTNKTDVGGCYERTSQAFFGSAWALLPEKWQEIAAFLQHKAAGEILSAAEIAAAKDQSRPQAIVPGAEVRGRYSQVAGKVGILDLFGVLSQRVGLLSAMSGGTSTQRFGQELDALVADNQVRSIVLVADSPGGSVFGTQELADKVYKARGEKKIVAVADSMAASAAYWIASQAGEVVVTPGGQVGSIGVVAAHRDVSKAEEQNGVKTTLISAGRYKTEGDPSSPLSAEGQEQLQKTVNVYYEHFVKAVARGRGVTGAKVESDFGQGRMSTAKEAVAAGMADRVATLEQVLHRLDGSSAATAQARARAVELE